MDDTKDDATKGNDPRTLDDLYRAFENADYILSKRYRYTLGEQPVCTLPEDIAKIQVGENFQVFRILKLVYDKNENTLDKLTTAYHTLCAYPDASIIMILISNGSSVELYGGTANRDIHPGGNCVAKKRGEQWATLRSALEANFPGGEFAETISLYDADSNKKTVKYFDRPSLIKRALPTDGIVSCVTGVAALRGDGEHKNENFVQGIEKLIDAMRGEPFSAVFIADCMPSTQIESICADYEDIYSQLSPFLQSQQTIGSSEGITNTDSLIKGVTDTTNESVSSSENHGITKGTSKSNSIGANVGAKNIGGFAAHTTGTNESTTDTTGTAKTTGSAKSLSSQNSVAKALTSSDSEAVQITYQNRAVKTLMERIDQQIKRLRSCEDYGIYDFGAYFIAETTPISKTAAANYDSLIRGESSSVEASAISTWSGDNGKLAIEYLKRLYHPLIAIPDYSSPKADEADKTARDLEYEQRFVTPTTLVSGKELAIHMGFPKKSVNGVAVLECAEFGREALKLSGEPVKGVVLGKVNHMRKTSDVTLSLNRNDLTAHTFITGSTGAGKSNTIYTMLDKLCLQGGEKTHFLVVEPAKGEYKDVFGGYDGVSVYGTNPKKAPLLRLNPFSFPDDIHVLEHIDRLVEIFNACWPMYAAMPAVLKDAIEASYVSCGWSLTHSECKPKRFPTFSTVMKKLPEIIGSSAYSSDTKGDYTGALVTRIKSLTNGINGQIFCSEDEISNEHLFDENVIVDLSRVGSMETKALLMGIMVMKLQEYRMSVGGSNQKLKHITVLEEAHNLLRRTSAEQTQESSNLQGKSVEMLANAIAEMRTYGEGFIIADQSPGLMDMSVIRNTNTKIIMRLPDESDRLLVGKAAGLNDDQIAELAKLGKGVAAVYQNDWLEPVLCEVDLFDRPKPYQFKDPGFFPFSAKEKLLRRITAGVYDGNPLSNEDVDQIKMWIDRVDTGREAKSLLLDALNGKALSENERGYLLYCLTKGKTVLGDQMKNAASPDTVRASVDSQISDMLNVSLELAEEIRKLIFIYAAQQVENDVEYRQDLLYYGGVR